MSLLGKIKYFFDGAEKAEESGLILSRRKFFIASAALLVVPKFLDPFFDKLHVTEIGSWPPEGGFSIGYTVGECTDFFSPGALEVQQYQEEMLNQLKSRSKLVLHGPLDAAIDPRDYEVRFFEKLEIPKAQFHRFEIGDLVEPRPRPILEVTKLGYRGRR